MTRYFFDIHDGGPRFDAIGVEFDTLEEVRVEAMRVLPAIACEDIPKEGDRRTFTCLVTDEDGRPVYSATLSFAGLWLKR